MKRTLLSAFGLATATVFLASCESSGNKATEPSPQPKPTHSSSQTPAPMNTEPLAVEETANVRVTAHVKDINYTTREVTLEDGAGRSTGIIVGPRVQRLNEVRVGDEVTTEYTISVLAERRPATAQEQANPISVVYLTTRSPRDAAPAGSEGKSVRVVTTITSIDTPKMLVTLKGPMGDTTIIRGRKADNIRRLNVGDTVVITFTNATAVSLDKRAG